VAAREVDLTDLLTAAGAALGKTNQRLQAAQSPAMLGYYDLTLLFNSRLHLQRGEVRFTRVTQSTLIFPAAATCTIGTLCPAANTTVAVHVIAAPALVPTAST